MQQVTETIQMEANLQEPISNSKFCLHLRKKKETKILLLWISRASQMKEEGTDTPEGLIRGAQSVPWVVDSHMTCGVKIPQCFSV